MKLRDTDILANQANRLAQIALDIATDLNHSKIDLKGKYLLGLLMRQTTLLQDIAAILTGRPDGQHSSVFILFRCLLDDHITIMHFYGNKPYDEPLLSHTASALEYWEKIILESSKINQKYFNGTSVSLATNSDVDKRKKDFRDTPDSSYFFIDETKTKFKKFPQIAQLVDKFEVNALNKAGVHSYPLWCYLSKYVHYSGLTFVLEYEKETFDLSIRQLREALFYVYRTIVMASDLLNELGLKNKLNDKTNVYEELKLGANVRMEEQ